MNTVIFVICLFCFLSTALAFITPLSYPQRRSYAMPNFGAVMRPFGKRSGLLYDEEPWRLAYTDEKF